MHTYLGWVGLGKTFSYILEREEEEKRNSACNNNYMYCRVLYIFCLLGEENGYISSYLQNGMHPNPLV